MFQYCVFHEIHTRLLNRETWNFQTCLAIFQFYYLILFIFHRPSWVHRYNVGTYGYGSPSWFCLLFVYLFIYFQCLRTVCSMRFIFILSCIKLETARAGVYFYFSISFVFCLPLFIFQWTCWVPVIRYGYRYEFVCPVMLLFTGCLLCLFIFQCLKLAC